MSNVIGDYESGNGKVGMGIEEWESGNGVWGLGNEKKWGMRMWFFLPPKMVGNGDWGMGNGFQNGECIRENLFFRK